jgi:hypothetical protein
LSIFNPVTDHRILARKVFCGTDGAWGSLRCGSPIRKPAVAPCIRRKSG